ncbi:MAG: pantoate--beta-alanine ligase [Candidatus Omnitrophota bacterium]
MQIVKTISEVRRIVSHARNAGKAIGFVPTMGALHKGHLSLIRASRKECGFRVVSIFVNPTQFGPKEDYRKYPQDLKRDTRMVEKEGIDLIFAPEADEIYPEGYQTCVEVENLPRNLCGKYRPGHFPGVATVVLKLFHIVSPDQAYFGWKDAQQLIIIKKMVEDLNLPIKVVGLPTVREKDGLAMSSRNQYLSPEERTSAPILYKHLKNVKRMVETKQKSLKEALKETQKNLNKNPLIKLQYLEAVDLKRVEPVTENTRGKVLVAVAAFFGSTRLIDNIIIRLP